MMLQREIAFAGLAAIAMAVLVHRELRKASQDSTLKDHIDIVLIAAAIVFLLVTVVQHPEWLW